MGVDVPVGRARWGEVVALRVAGHSVKECAKRLGVTPNAVGDTLRIPEVAAQVEAQRLDTLDEVRSRLVDSAVSAQRVLLELANDPEQPGATRLKAATELLDRVGLVKADHRTVDVRHSGEVQHRPVLDPRDLRQLDAEGRRRLAERLHAEIDATRVQAVPPELLETRHDVIEHEHDEGPPVWDEDLGEWRAATVMDD